MRVVAVLLLAASLLAGCAETPAPDPASPRAVEEGTASPDGTVASLARFARDAGVDETAEFSGAFAAQEMGGAVADARELAGVEPENVHAHDLSALVPLGVPARIRFDVAADAGRGDIDAWIQMEPEAIWWARGEAPFGGNMWFEYHVMRKTQEPVLLLVRYDEPSEHPEIAYVATVDVNADADVLRAGVPAALALPQGATTLVVESDAVSDGGALLVWDAQDRFLQRVPLTVGNTTIALGEDAVEGEYVLMLSEGAARARVLVVGAAETPLLRPVAREVVVGEAQRGEKSASWSFETRRVPLMIGIAAQGGEVAHEFTATLSSEAGPVLSRRIVDDVPWLLGVGFGMLSAPGDENVIAGRYDAHAGFAASAGPTSFDATEVLVFHKR